MAGCPLDKPVMTQLVHHSHKRCVVHSGSHLPTSLVHLHSILYIAILFDFMLYFDDVHTHFSINFIHLPPSSSSLNEQCSSVATWGYLARWNLSYFVHFLFHHRYHRCFHGWWFHHFRKNISLQAPLLHYYQQNLKVWNARWWEPSERKLRLQIPLFTFLAW